MAVGGCGGYTSGYARSIVFGDIGSRASCPEWLRDYSAAAATSTTSVELLRYVL